MGTHLPHHRLSLHMGAVEQRIPVGKEGITLLDGFSDEPGMLVPEQPGLPPLGIHGGVATEEGLVGSGLVPTH